MFRFSETKMLETRLEDFTLDALRTQADRLGVTDPRLDKAALITAIRGKLREQNRSNRWREIIKVLLTSLPSLIISVVATCIAVYAAVQNQKQAKEAKRQSDVAVAALTEELRRNAEAAFEAKRQTDVAVASLTEQIERNTEATRRTHIESWQTWVVFSVIDRKSKERPEGITYDEIRSSYIEEATAVTEIELPREELGNHKLERILMGLRQTQMIYKTHDDKFVSNRSEINITFGRGPIIDRAKVAIIAMVSKEKGKHTQQTLQSEICQQFGLSPQEFLVTVTDMIAAGALVTDKGRIYWVLDAPEKGQRENSETESSKPSSEETSGQN